MQLPAAAPLALWPSLLAVQGPGDASQPHEHHTFHLVLAREGTLVYRGPDDVPHEAAAVLTAPDVRHAITVGRGPVLLLFVDPESEPGARLRASLNGAPERRFAPDERDALVDGLPAVPGSSELERWMRAVITTLAGPDPVRPSMHPRVRKLLRALESLPPEAETSLEALAAQVGLSPSRLLHVFTESVGVPLRPYVRWLRVQRATASIVSGAPLAQAAAEAGFADAAHMSRTFKDMFGLAPSALQRRSQSVQARASLEDHPPRHGDDSR